MTAFLRGARAAMADLLGADDLGAGVVHHHRNKGHYCEQRHEPAGDELPSMDGESSEDAL